MKWLKRWIWNLLIATDQWFNAFFHGDPDETISSRAAKAQIKGRRWGCLLCRFLDIFEKDHCIKSIEYDEGERIDPLPSEETEVKSNELS